MSQNTTRKGERAKKPPKYILNDDADYGPFLSTKAIDQRDKINLSQETNQIARLLTKFTQSINLKFRQYNEENMTDKNINPKDKNAENQIKGQSRLQNSQNMMSNQQTMHNQGFNKRGRQHIQKSHSKNPNGRIQNKQFHKSFQNNNPQIQSDLDYHNMLNEHIKSAYPNISNISADMLKGLQIPKQLLEIAQGGKSKGKSGNPSKSSKTKDGKQDFKPFKRQSYHVAISYYIYLKNFKGNNSNSNEIDPTYPARKMKEAHLGQNKNNK